MNTVSNPFSALPRGGPEIEGGHPRYNMGDRVNVTCVSRNSLPAAQLSWYINGEKADKQGRRMPAGDSNEYL